MKALSVEGLVAAAFTPMHADGTVNLDAIGVLAEAFVANGVAGVFACGTTGECMSLTVGERMQVAERWRAVAGEELKVIVHAGHLCLAECRALAEHAQEIGADAIAAFGPFYYRPATVEDLVEFCAEAADAAPGLPFYYYHIPSMTRLDFKMVDFLRLAADRISTLAGMKFTHNDMMDYGRCVQFRQGRFEMLFGRDEFLLAGLALGARGGVGTTYNYAAPVYRRIMDAFQAGLLDDARKDQVRAAELLAVLREFVELPAGKAVMKMIGLDCGPVRLPLRDLTEGQCNDLRAELEGQGFFDYCTRRP